MTDDQHVRPTLRVVRGEPTAAELAALVVVLGARAAAATTGASGQLRSSWNDPARLVRHPQPSRSGGWRASALPR